MCATVSSSVAPIPRLTVVNSPGRFVRRKNTKKKLFQELVENILTDAGKRIVSCTLKDERMYPAREKTLRDITSPSGLASMTGMDFWRLGGIMLPLLRMCLVSERAMVGDARGLGVEP